MLCEEGQYPISPSSYIYIYIFLFETENIAIASMKYNVFVCL